MGFPWWSSGKTVVLPMQGTQAPSLLRKRRSPTPQGAAKKEKEREIYIK